MRTSTYKTDRLAFRARILKVHKNNDVELIMLDYGDCVQANRNDLYYLSSSINRSVPYQVSV